MTLNIYVEKLKYLSQALVEAQRPIRILDAIKWDASIEKAFFDSRCQKIPEVGVDYYARVPLGFDPEQKTHEFIDIISRVRRDLGDRDELGHMLIRNAEQYMDVVQMLSVRGTKKFWDYSRKLYGSPKDRFFSDSNSIVALGQTLYDILSRLDETAIGPGQVANKKAPEVVHILQDRFERSFLYGCVEVKLSDGIVADAAAGSNYIKIREEALFTDREIDVIEVHEGWVHVTTTSNGALQPYAKWLAKGPPRCTVTQEGLAILMEVITFRSHPRRMRKINDRILGINMAEDGANALELFSYYQSHGYSEAESYRNVMRICRGGLALGGAPFTKDICYCQGFIENYNFIRSAIRKGRPELIRFLFAGKLHVRDIPLLYQKHLEGIVMAPSLLPPPFVDLSGLAVWMSFSNFLNRVDLKTVQDDYDALFEKYA